MNCYCFMFYAMLNYIDESGQHYITSTLVDGERAMRGNNPELLTSEKIIFLFTLQKARWTHREGNAWHKCISSLEIVRCIYMVLNNAE